MGDARGSTCAPGQAAGAGQPVKISVTDLTVSYGRAVALRGANIEVHDRSLLTIMGPTGSGKTTFLRSLNRLNDFVAGSAVKGRVAIDGRDVYGPGVNVADLRRRVGMVFALPVALPMSVFDNVAYGPRLHGVTGRAELSEIVERSLRQAILWDEVKDRLAESALRLSGGQQQRLSIARVLAVSPEVILLDEPCSGLDPISTLRIEQLMLELAHDYTVVLVTHNPQEAARLGVRVAVFYLGELVESGPAGTIFTAPKDPRTEAFISGRVG